LEDEFKEYLKWASSQGISSFDVYREAVNLGFNPQQLKEVNDYYGRLSANRVVPEEPKPGSQGLGYSYDSDDAPKGDAAVAPIIQSESLSEWFQSQGYSPDAKPYRYDVSGPLLGMQPSSTTPGGAGGAAIYGSTFDRGRYLTPSGERETAAQRIQREQEEAQLAQRGFEAPEGSPVGG
jgi:hypothetical protein